MSETFNVTIKTGGALTRYLPEDGEGSTRVLQFEQPTSVQDILQQWQVPEDQPMLTILNDTMVTRPDYATTLLSDQDVLSLMPAITAG